MDVIEEQGIIQLRNWERFKNFVCICKEVYAAVGDCTEKHNGKQCGGFS